MVTAQDTPPCFASLTGHQAECSQLIGSLQRETMAGSFIFHGEEGIGKFLIAKLLARLLHCLNPVDHTPCNRCESCSKYTLTFRQGVLECTSSHPDIDVLDAERFSKEGKALRKPVIKIDAVRDFQEEVSAKPYISPCKVGIINDAHLMNTEAANCLLKTLEEPPEGVVLILITSSLGRILPTIRSRCRHQGFHPLQESDIRAVLIERGVESAKADIISFFIGGSLGGALSTDFEELEDRVEKGIRFLSLFFRREVFERFRLMEELAKSYDPSSLHQFLWILQKVLSSYVAGPRRKELFRTGIIPDDITLFDGCDAQRIPLIASSMVRVIDRVRVDLSSYLNTHLLLETMNIKLYDVLERTR